MRILGIDPGSHRLGWGVVATQGSRLVHVASGTLAAPAKALGARLLFLGNGLDALIAQHRPQAAGVEQVFHAKNAQSALILGHARGVALLCLERAGLEVGAYTPGQIKQAVTGRGNADKVQVQIMIRMLLGLPAPVGLDTSDALAAALCHAQMGLGSAAQFLAKQAAERRPSPA